MSNRTAWIGLALAAWLVLLPPLALWCTAAAPAVAASHDCMPPAEAQVLCARTAAHAVTRAAVDALPLPSPVWLLPRALPAAPVPAPLVALAGPFDPLRRAGVQARSVPLRI